MCNIFLKNKSVRFKCSLVRGFLINKPNVMGFLRNILREFKGSVEFVIRYD